MQLPSRGKVRHWTASEGNRAISVHCRFVAATELSDSRICAIRRHEAGELAAKNKEK
jgi:hypothetical protein